jgi:hypothetical protein
LEKQISKKLPSFKRKHPGLRIRIKGLKGSIVEGELPKYQSFRKEIALGLKK